MFSLFYLNFHVLLFFIILLRIEIFIFKYLFRNYNNNLIKDMDFQIVSIMIEMFFNMIHSLVENK